ncbi:MAG: UPF0489 family protein [Candidatus Muiribacteriaceae bacterium]
MKLSVVEEHHESFPVWMYLIKHGLMSEEGGIILHADHHDDLDNPCLNTSIDKIMKSDIRDILDFTYKELKIFDYILPALYLKIFRKYYWIKRNYTGTNTEKRFYVKTHKREGKLFYRREAESPWHTFIPDDGRVYYDHYQLNVSEPMTFEGNVFLDIDLDYFSAHTSRPQKRSLEITESEYKRIVQDRYHFLKNEYRFALREEDNRYFVDLFDSAEKVDSASETDKKELFGRISEFLEYLENNKVIPDHILICRSRHSNYTPADQWEYIEKHLINGLETLYKFEILPLEDLQ